MIRKSCFPHLSYPLSFCAVLTIIILFSLGLLYPPLPFLFRGSFYPSCRIFTLVQLDLSVLWDDFTVITLHFFIIQFLFLFPSSFNVSLSSTLLAQLFFTFLQLCFENCAVMHYPLYTFCVIIIFINFVSSYLPRDSHPDYTKSP